MAKKFEEMTPEERQSAFNKWIAGRETRKGQNAAKKTANKQLVANHEPEYKKLVAASKATVKPLPDLTVEQKAAAYDELMGKKVKKQGKRASEKDALKALIKAHKPEHDKLVTAAGGKVKED